MGQKKMAGDICEQRQMTQLPINKGGWQRLLRRIKRVVPNSTLAEDCLQDAYIRLAERMDETVPRDTESYLVRTACNLAIDEYRRGKVHSQSGDVIRSLLTLDGDGPLQDEILVARQRLFRVEEGLKRLPTRTREIFLMHRIEGMKYREIAVAEQISVSAVEKHIANAMFFLTKWARNW
jgi:RNA polymerase sigma-70 factor (ECF subfamily)